MQYNGPFDQPGSPNASYTNGNVNIGLQGSVPAAGAIEYPQRELVNFETDSGLTPTNADLHQLGEAVQAARVAFAVDVGTPGAIVINLTPMPPAIAQGLVVRVLIANNVPGPTTLNPNGLGAFNTRYSGLPLSPNILEQGDVGEFIFDGTNFQLIGGARGIKQILSIATTYYVNPVTGNDLNDGLTAGTAWATLNHAYSWLQQHVDFNGQTVTIDCAFPNSPTVYAPFAANGPITGVFTPSQLLIVGDLTNSKCSIGITSTGGICVNATAGAKFQMSGFRISSTGSQGVGLSASAGGEIIVGSFMQFNSCNTYAMNAAGSGSSITTSGASISITGTSVAFFSAGQNASMNIGDSTFVFTSAGVTAGTIQATDASSVLAGAGFGFSGGVTGPRFNLQMNSILDTGGNMPTANTAYIPGSTSGASATGGQFV